MDTALPTASPPASPTPPAPAPPVLGRLAADAAVSQPALPRFLQLEPTGRCNLACRMCAVHERGDAVADLPLARLRELLDAMPQLQQLHLQGLGEPMLHPQFFEMVELAVGRGLWVSANTNATLLTPARAERCISSGLSALSVSIDGASAAVYEAIRLRGNFSKVLRNLQRLTAARDAANSPLGVRGVMVLMRSNLAELPALVRLLAEHGVFELLVQRLANELDDRTPRYIPIRRYIDGAELQAADAPQAARVFDEARAEAARLGLQLHLPRLSPRGPGDGDGDGDGNGNGNGEEAPPAAGPRCGWPWQQLYLTAAGHMLPCCMVGTADRASFGRVFGDDPAQPANPLPAWHGAVAQGFRHGLTEGPPPAVCRGCALYNGRF